MIYIQKKNNQLLIFESSDGDKVESFSMLKLNLHELECFLNSGVNCMHPNEKTLALLYSQNDPLDRLFKKIALQHKEANSNFKDVSTQYISSIEGTSMLLRDPQKDIIRIAYRKNNNTCDINRLFISNDIREQFFADTKRGSYFHTTGKYALDITDISLYDKWSSYMDTEYFKEITNN